MVDLYEFDKGGRFGIGTLPTRAEIVEERVEVEPENYMVGLVRTTLLPAEMEEEWRKRKEMQSLRRMEAKRRRCEKLRVVNYDESFENERWVTVSKVEFLQRHLVSSNGQASNDGGGSSSSLSELDHKN